MAMGAQMERLRKDRFALQVWVWVWVCGCVGVGVGVGVCVCVCVCVHAHSLIISFCTYDGVRLT